MSSLHTEGGAEKSLGRVALKRLRATEEILDVALDILSEHGVDGLTLAAVTDQLGLTRPAIYHYFGSKEQLIHHLVLELIRRETRMLTQALSNQQADAVLGVLVRTFVDYYRPRLNAFRLIYCRFQLADVQALGFDQKALQSKVHPLTQTLFDTVVARLRTQRDDVPSEDLRRLAFSAWLSAVGLVDMLGIVEASEDTLRFSEESLVRTFETVFNTHVQHITP